jgi:hypothetical protein
MIFLTILVFLAAAFVFADNFTVVSVTGRVERESGNQRIDVRANEVLDGSVIIYTGVGASVVLRDESGRSITVSAGRNGSIAELASASTPTVRVGGTISRTDTSAVGRTTAQVGTASARASVSVMDIEVAIEGCICVICGDVCDEGCLGSCNMDGASVE